MISPLSSPFHFHFLFIASLESRSDQLSKGKVELVAQAEAGHGENFPGQGPVFWPTWQTGPGGWRCGFWKTFQSCVQPSASAAQPEAPPRILGASREARVEGLGGGVRICLCRAAGQLSSASPHSAGEAVCLRPSVFSPESRVSSLTAQIPGNGTNPSSCPSRARQTDRQVLGGRGVSFTGAGLHL